MLYLIGLGLDDALDITVKGRHICQACDSVFLDAYTSALCCATENILHETYDCVSADLCNMIRTSSTGPFIELAFRDTVESDDDRMLALSSVSDVAFLVVGDPCSATTHHDIILRARKRGIHCEIVSNASIMSIISWTGLERCKFSETVSIPFWDEFNRPDSFLQKILRNLSNGSHTLCLLDIQMREQSTHNLLRGRKIYEPPRFMLCWEACQLIKAIVGNSSLLKLILPLLCIGIANLGGGSRQRQCVSTMQNFADMSPELCGKILGGPLQSLVICGHMNEMEVKFISNHMRHPDNLTLDASLSEHDKILRSDALQDAAIC